MSFWERGHELDQRLLRWMWDEDGKVKWWLWLIAAAALGWMAVSDVDTGWGVAGRLVIPSYCLVLAALSLVRRRRRP